MRLSITTATALAIAAALLGPGTASAEPALTLTRNCDFYPPQAAVVIDLTGLPPDTPFTGSLRFDGGGIGPAQFTTDASGSFHIGPIGSPNPATFTATVEWAGGTLVTSLAVNCAVPASKTECKNGGWRNFPDFKNQGDCINAVKPQ